MNIIIDTNIFIFAIQSPNRLQKQHKKLILDTSNNLYLSSLSIAEISIKKSISKLDLIFDFEKISFDLNLEILDFKLKEAQILEHLPLHHKDPFDRMIISQAIANNYHLITTDKHFSNYNCKLL
jgi:PIN domain nuclease of toxin-antitoxin system